MKNGNQFTIPTEPADVYGVLAALLKSNRLPIHEHAAVAYAMVAMRSAFPVSLTVAAVAVLER